MNAAAAKPRLLKPEVTADPTAGVYEAWLVSVSGEREWIGAYDTHREANDAAAVALSAS